MGSCECKNLPQARGKANDGKPPELREKKSLETSMNFEVQQPTQND